MTYTEIIRWFTRYGGGQKKFKYGPKFHMISVSGAECGVRREGCVCEGDVGDGYGDGVRGGDGGNRDCGV